MPVKARHRIFSPIGASTLGAGAQTDVLDMDPFTAAIVYAGFGTTTIAVEAEVANGLFAKVQDLTVANAAGLDAFVLDYPIPGKLRFNNTGAGAANVRIEGVREIA